MLLKRAFNKETEEDREELKQEISAKKMRQKSRCMDYGNPREAYGYAEKCMDRN